MASPTSSRSSSRVNTSPLDARVWATIPTAFRLTMAHPCRRDNAHTTTARRAAPEGANLSILNDQLYTGSALDRGQSVAPQARVRHGSNPGTSSRKVDQDDVRVFSQ